MIDEDLEDFCGELLQRRPVSVDRGLGVWVCSLNANHLGPHVAYPWHDVSSRPEAVWTNDELLFYRVWLGE